MRHSGCYSRVFLVALGLSSAAWGQNVRQTTTRPVEDTALQAEMAKLIAWLDTGDPEQQLLAVDALRMAPAAALPAMKQAIDAKRMKPELQNVLEQIYQDQQTARAGIEAGLAAARKWEADFVAAYDTCAERNPAWDDAARTLMKSAWEERLDKAQRAAAIKTLLDTHCTDPFVMYCAQPNFESGLPVQKRMEVLRRVLDSKWVGGAKLEVARAALYSGDAEWNDDQKKEVAELVNLTADRMAEMVKDRPRRRTVRELVARQIAALMKINKCDAWAAYLKIKDKVSGPIRAMNAATLDCIEGQAHYDTSWSLRGTGWAGDVAKEKWETIHQQCDDALASFHHALEEDPTNDVAALGVLGSLLIADGDIEKSTAAFYQVLKCNPDSYQAVNAVTHHYMARWYGGDDSEKLLTHLAKACALSRNFRAGIPQMVCDILKNERADLTPQQKEASAQDLRLLVRYVFDTATVLNPTEFTFARGMNAHLMFGDTVRARNCMEKLGARADVFGPQFWGNKWSEVRAQMTNPDLPAKGDPNNRPSWLP